jgi:outer membrane protein assembly factor BamB
MSFNPTTGLVYFTATIDGGSNYAVNPDFTYQPGRHNEGLARGATPTGPKPQAIGPPAVDGQRTVLLAWDPVTQTERWRAPAGGARFGGTLTTAGNLVFQVVPDGRFIAYHAENGKKMFELQMETKTGMGPPITYLVDGRQYVAFMGGVGQPPTSAAAVSSPKLFAFVLESDKASRNR